MFMKYMNMALFAPDEKSGGGGTSSAPSATSPTTSPSSAPGPSASPAPSGPSGAPSAPSTSPSGPAPEGGASPSGPGAEQYDFSSVFGDDWFGPAAATPPTPVAPAPIAPEKPVVPPVVPPAASPSPPAPEAQPQASPTEGRPATTETQGPPPLDVGDPSGMAAALVRNRDAYIEHLAQNQFTLSQEDISNLESDVTGTIPRLLARTQVDTMATMLTHMGRSVPLMVQRYMETSKARDEAEGAFYKRWPDIDRAKHGQLVQQYAVTLRSMHPHMPMQEMIEKVGPMVMMAAQIVPGSSQAAQRPASGAGAPQPVAPANGSHPPQPFVPALPGTAQAAPTPDPNDNFGWMGQNE